MHSPKEVNREVKTTSPYEMEILMGKKSKEFKSSDLTDGSPNVEVFSNLADGEAKNDHKVPKNIGTIIRKPKSASEKLWKVRISKEMVFGSNQEITFYRWMRPNCKGHARVKTVNSNLQSKGLKPDMFLLMIGKKNVFLCDFDEQNEILRSQLELKDQKFPDSSYQQVLTFCEASPYHHWIPGTAHNVGIRAEIRAITAISTVEQNFNCRVSLKYVWQPTRQEIQNYDKNNEWNKRNWRPRLEFPNAQTFQRREQKKLLLFDENECTRSVHGSEDYVLIKNGQINSKGFLDKMTVDCVFMGSIEVNATFAEQLELRMFPFDTQDLTISVWSSIRTDRMQFIPYGHFFENQIEFVNLSTTYCSITNEWDIFDPIADIENGIFSTLHIRNKVQRRPEVFFWRMIVPMSLITTAALFSFFLDLSVSGERIAYAFTAVLTSVVFQMTIYGNLPDISYMTLLDWYLLIMFLFMLGIVLQTGIFTMLFDDSADIDEENSWRKRDGIAAYIFTVIFVLLHIWLIIRVKRGQNREATKLSMNGRELDTSFSASAKQHWKKVKSLYRTTYDHKNKWTESYTTKKKAKELKMLEL